MKILEAQSATLTNYEVYSHLVEQRARYAARGRRRGPGNLETVVKEIQEYLRTNHLHSPLGSNPIPYTDTTIRTLLERLRPYDLTKAEFIMIMNLRPKHVAALHTVIEEMEERFPDEATQQEIVEIILEVLGSPDDRAERQVVAGNATRSRVRDRKGASSSGADFVDDMLVDET